MRWANGSGTTFEILARPFADDWDWRLSLAELGHDGPFSVLPGVDRCLVVATGNGMTLHVGGRSHALGCFDSVEFAGDEESHAVLHDGPVRDLNLMVRRGRGIGRPRLDILRAAPGTPVAMDGAPALVVLDGTLCMTPDGGVSDDDPESADCRASSGDVFIAEPADSNGGIRIQTTSAAVVARVHFLPPEQDSR